MKRFLSMLVLSCLFIFAACNIAEVYTVKGQIDCVFPPPIINDSLSLVGQKAGPFNGACPYRVIMYDSTGAPVDTVLRDPYGVAGQ